MKFFLVGYNTLYETPYGSKSDDPSYCATKSTFNLESEDYSCPYITFQVICNLFLFFEQTFFMVSGVNLNIFLLIEFLTLFSQSNTV